MPDAMQEKLSWHQRKKLSDPGFLERKRASEKEWAKNHPEAIKQKQRRQYLARHEEICKRHRDYYRKYYAEHREEILAKRKTEEARAYFREQIKKKRHSDKKFQIRSRVSSQIWWALHRKDGIQRRDRLESVLGYPVTLLESHLEKQFRDGMSWDLFMNGAIHIDHKIPVDAFNFSSTRDVDFRRCFSLSNLQPLWSDENLRKGKRLSVPHQPMLRLEV
jgi:hypothetical protein